MAVLLLGCTPSAELDSPLPTEVADPSTGGEYAEQDLATECAELGARPAAEELAQWLPEDRVGRGEPGEVVLAQLDGEGPAEALLTVSYAVEDAPEDDDFGPLRSEDVVFALRRVDTRWELAGSITKPTYVDGSFPDVDGVLGLRVIRVEGCRDVVLLDHARGYIVGGLVGWRRTVDVLSGHRGELEAVQQIEVAHVYEARGEDGPQVEAERREFVIDGYVMTIERSQGLAERVEPEFRFETVDRVEQEVIDLRR